MRPPRAVDEPSPAYLVDDCHLLGSLDGILHQQVVETVALVGQGRGRQRLPLLPHHRAVDGGADPDALGALGDDSRQHQHLGVHAGLLGEMPAAQPDVVPAHVLDGVDLLVVFQVRLLLEERAAPVVGMPGHHVALVQGIPSIEQSEIHSDPPGPFANPSVPSQI